jgi:hypothetical protein
MSAKTKYSDEPLGRLKIVRAFLPRPQDLVFREIQVGEPRLALAEH